MAPHRGSNPPSDQHPGKPPNPNSEERPELPKDFIRITDPAEEEILFREGLRTQAQAILWTTGKTHLIKTQLHSKRHAASGFAAHSPPGLDIPTLTLEMARAGLNEFFFSVSLSRANILFKSAYLGYNDEGLHFRDPDKLYKVQRRKNMRMQVREGYILKVTFEPPVGPPGEVISRKVYDLSAGGISFMLDRSEAGNYLNDSILRNLTFIVRQRRITVDGSIRYCRPFLNGSFKVGVFFQDLHPADSAHIENYVLEENTRLLSRFL